MMRRLVNTQQVRVLAWIADGSPPDGVPTVGSLYKTSAYALAARGLVRVDRRRGSWRAELTDAGGYFLTHGTYPPAEPAAHHKRVRSRSPRVQAGPPVASPSQLADDNDEKSRRLERTSHPSRSAGGPGLPVVSQIRSPHPAIRELVDHPNRVALPAQARRRALLISHTLVQEALGREWKVTAIRSELRDRWPSGRERSWPSKDLLRLDAGSQAVGIQFRFRTRRIEHVETPKEARARARGAYVSAPRYDHQPTDVLRLFLYQAPTGRFLRRHGSPATRAPSGRGA